MWGSKPSRAARLAWLGIVLATPTWAGVSLPQADLSMAVTISPAQASYPPGTMARLDYTVHNAGPDDAPGAYAAAGTFAFGGPNSQVLLVPSDDTEPCVHASLDLGASPGYHGFSLPSLTFPAIPAGASTTCSLVLMVLDTARGDYILEGQVSPPTGGTAEDPNPGNNEVTLVVPLSDTPPATTDLSVALELVSPMAVVTPGSEVRLRVTTYNDGPGATAGSLVTFDPAWIVDPSAPAYLRNVVSPDQPGCSAQLVPAANPTGFTVGQVQLSGLAPGQSRSCELRLFVLDTAPAVFEVRAFGTPVPDFGDPTIDPDGSDDNALLMIRTEPGMVAPSPVVVPAVSVPILVMLVLLFGGIGVAAERRIR